MRSFYFCLIHTGTTAIAIFDTRNLTHHINASFLAHQVQLYTRTNPILRGMLSALLFAQSDRTFAVNKNVRFPSRQLAEGVFSAFVKPCRDLAPSRKCLPLPRPPLPSTVPLVSSTLLLPQTLS